MCEDIVRVSNGLDLAELFSVLSGFKLLDYGRDKLYKGLMEIQTPELIRRCYEGVSVQSTERASFGFKFSTVLVQLILFNAAAD